MGLKVAIIGAGMGGLACAAALRRHGADVAIYEQAEAFKRIGAGIQMTPNAVMALRGLGLEEALRAVAFEAVQGHNREALSGEITNVIELGASIVKRCGAPLLTLHRGDLHSVLLSAVPQDIIHMKHRLTAYSQRGGAVHLQFENGAQVEADCVIAADGVHSIMREQMLGREAPRFTGKVAYRATFPAALIGDLQIDDRCKWWGADRHIVIYYTTRQRSEIYFVTSTPEPDYNLESWSTKGDLDELRAAYSAFHPTVRAVLDACPEVHKWALVVREPLPRWHEEHVTLLGDACHPMTPYMAQGAASAIEDAVILSRCLDRVGKDKIEQAFARYHATRFPRVTAIQQTSAQNNWMKEKTSFDWVYGHNVWSQDLA